MKPDRAVSLAHLVALASVAFLWSCASLTGGDVTETGNARISGRIIDTLGSGVQGVRVRLLPDIYDPVRDGTPSDLFVTITDEAGCYIVPTPGDGIYNIEAIYPSTGDRALISGIVAVRHDTVFAPTATILRPGAINVLVPSQAAAAAAYVYLPGTTRFGRVAGSIAIIDSVPVGSFTALCYVNQSDTTQNHSIKTNFTVTPACTTFITADHAWNFSRNLYINTTLSGAAVGGNVYSFPVLVRLSAGNLVFSQAKSGGEDVRFVKADGSPLPFEIERWDPAAQQAEIWVKVDTVYGNDSSHYFTMLWGDSSSTGSSNGAAVFDTANGFQGVWHLNEPGNAIAKDATGNHYDGTPSDTAPTGAEGTIGPCRSFNGSSNFIRMNGTADSKLNFQENGTYTVSAWAYADTLDNGSHLVVGKSNEQYFHEIQILRTRLVPWYGNSSSTTTNSGWCITNSLPVVPSAKTWAYIVGVRKGTAQYFYLNGELVDSTISVSAGNRAEVYGG